MWHMATGLDNVRRYRDAGIHRMLVPVIGKPDAVIEALGILTRPCDVVLHTDSQYVQKGISEWIHGWKKRGWKTASKEPVKNEDLWRALDAAQAEHKVDWRWVRGHNGHPGNERADVLANRGVEIIKQR